MLCAKCHKNEAVIHFTICAGDSRSERIDLCEECAPSTGFANVTVEQLKAFSTVGKNCDFCGQTAISGQITTGGGTIYWCSDCGAEFAEILMDQVKSARPDLVMTEGSCVAYCMDSEAQAWAADVTQEAVRILKEKRGKNGQDTGS